MSSGSCGVSVVSLGQHTQIHTQQQLDETEKHNFVCVAVHFLHLNILWKQLSNTRGRPAVATRKQRQGQKQATEELAAPRGAHSSVCLMWLLQAELLPGQVSPWDVNWRSCDFESVSPFWLVARWLGDYVPRCGAQCLLCGGLVLFKLHIFYWVTWVAVSLKLLGGLRQPRLFCRGTEIAMTVTTAAAIVTGACPASCDSARSCSSHSRYFR